MPQKERYSHAKETYSYAKETYSYAKEIYACERKKYIHIHKRSLSFSFPSLLKSRRFNPSIMSYRKGAQKETYSHAKETYSYAKETHSYAKETDSYTQDSSFPSFSRSVSHGVSTQILCLIVPIRKKRPIHIPKRYIHIQKRPLPPFFSCSLSHGASTRALYLVVQVQKKKTDSYTKETYLYTKDSSSPPILSLSESRRFNWNNLSHRIGAKERNPFICKRHRFIYKKILFPPPSLAL